MSCAIYVHLFYSYTCGGYMLYFFFFFKQKTAYEMRISDWSSDVCSSDLRGGEHGGEGRGDGGQLRRVERAKGGEPDDGACEARRHEVIERGHEQEQDRPRGPPERLAPAPDGPGAQERQQHHHAQPPGKGAQGTEEGAGGSKWDRKWKLRGA